MSAYNSIGAAWGDAVWDYGLWTDTDIVTTYHGGEKDEATKKPDGFDLGKPRKISGQLKTNVGVFFGTLARKFVTEGMLTLGYTKKYDQRKFNV